MAVADPGFRRVQVSGAKLNRARAEREGGGDSRASPIPPAATTGTRTAVGDLRQQGEQAHRFGRIGAEEAAAVTAGLESLGDDGLGAAPLEPDRFFDRGGIADDDCADGLHAPTSVGIGQAEVETDGGGPNVFDRRGHRQSNGSRIAPPLPRRDAELFVIRT